jgi:hypothetical protein
MTTAELILSKFNLSILWGNYQYHWQNSPFSATAYLGGFYHIASSFHFFGFQTTIFYRSNLLAWHPTPNLKDQVPIFTSPSDRVAHLYTQTQGFFSSPSTTHRATVEVF